MTEFETVDGKFVEKNLVSEGTTKTGKKYKNWKLFFRPEENSPITFGLTYFQRQAKDSDDFEFFPELEEGRWYTCACKINVYNNEHGEQRSRQAFKFNLGRKTDKPISRQQQL